MATEPLPTRLPERIFSPEIRQAIRILASVLLADIVSRLAHLGEPYWALITAVIVTQAKVGATLETGRDQIVGTLVGAVFGAAAIALWLTGLPKLPVFACLLVPLALMAAYRPNLRLAGVTLVVVFLFPTNGADPYSRPIDRTLAILVGAAASVLVSLLVFRARGRRQAFEAAAATLDRLDALQHAVLHGGVGIETISDDVTEALKTLVTAVAEAKRERLGAADNAEPLLGRLPSMLRRLQSDLLFVARARAETDPPPQLDSLSAPLSDLLRAMRSALDHQAGSGPEPALLPEDAEHLTLGIRALADSAGPLPRFTLQMLDRDLRDTVLALAPEPPADHRP